MEEENLIECLVCGKKVKKIHWSHLKNGCRGLFKNTKEYKEKYPNAILYSGKKTGFSLEKAIEKYGEIEGNKVWENYTDKHRYKNSYEGKKNKYGWTKDQYNKYNLKRAVTLDNLIIKYGIDEGTKRFNEYCEKQKYAGCKLEYFIEKYGEIEGTKIYKDLNKRKALTRDNFILKYGDILGSQKYIDYLNHHSASSSTLNNVSLISQKFCENIDKLLDISYNTYYHNKNNEYVAYLYKIKRPAFLDFYSMSTNKAIEFYGDYWHANPAIYQENSIIKFPRDIVKTACEIWKYDRERIEEIYNEHKIRTLIVWERDYIKESEIVIKRCLEFITNDTL